MTIPLQVTRQKFGFERTVCDCETCVRNCKTKPAMLIPSDIVAIRDKVAPNLSLEDFARKFLLASSNTKAFTPRGAVSLSTLVPARQENGHCIFLNNDRCTIHEVSPYGCAFFDGKDSNGNPQDMVIEGLKDIVTDKDSGIYASLWCMLMAEAKIAPKIS